MAKRKPPVKKRAPSKQAVKRKPVKAAPKREKTIFTFKLFDKWESKAEIKDPGLKNYINLEARLLPRSAGVHRNKFHKSKTHIVERLALKLMVSGHTGKRHRLSSGIHAGNYSNTVKIVEDALDMVEKKTKKNPIEVLVAAIENAAVREEVLSYQLGSIVAREAVVTSPQRRIDKVLKYFSQGSYRSGFRKKKTVAEGLANEILAAHKGSSDSYAIKEKERLEKEAMGAR